MPSSRELVESASLYDSGYSNSNGNICITKCAIEVTLRRQLFITVGASGDSKSSSCQPADFALHFSAYDTNVHPFPTFGWHLNSIMKTWLQLNSTDILQHISVALKQCSASGPTFAFATPEPQRSAKSQFLASKWRNTWNSPTREKKRRLEDSPGGMPV